MNPTGAKIMKLRKHSPLHGLIISLCLLAVLGACTTRVQSNPSRTATEQLLISIAADRAAEKLAIDLRAGNRVFLDTSHFEGTDSAYAISAIRAALLKKGAALVENRQQADVVAEVRSGALSTDENSMLIGVPAFSVPVPLAAGTFPFPEVALYKDAEQKGVAKFAVATYTAKDGNLLSAQDPQYGFSYYDEHTVLVFITWKDSDTLVQEDKAAWQRGVDSLGKKFSE
jgi:hypothetical protein